MTNVERPILGAIELGDPTSYLYISHREVTSALEEFGYGPTKRFVDALYIAPDQQLGVGVLQVTQERCEDHFVNRPILRGVDQIEAMGQTLLLLLHFTGRIQEDHGPLFKAAEEVKWELPAVPPVDLNIVVKILETQGSQVTAYSQVMCGETIIARGMVSGVLAPRRAVNILCERRLRVQFRTVPLFKLRK